MNVYNIITKDTNNLSNLLSTDVQHGIDILEEEFKKELLKASTTPVYYSTKVWSEATWGAACHGTIPKDIVYNNVIPLSKRTQYIHLPTACKKSKKSKREVQSNLKSYQVVDNNPQLHGRWITDPTYLLDVMRSLSISEPFDYERIQDIYRWCFYQEELPYNFTFKQLDKELKAKQKQVHYLLNKVIPAVVQFRNQFKTPLSTIQADVEESYTLIVSNFSVLNNKTMFKLWINSPLIQTYTSAISQYKIINLR